MLLGEGSHPSFSAPGVWAESVLGEGREQEELGWF